MADPERRGRLSIDPKILDAMNVLTSERNARVFGTLFCHAPQYCNELARRLRMYPNMVEGALGDLVHTGLVERHEDKVVAPLFTPTRMGIGLGLLAHSGRVPGITFTRGR